MRNDLFLFIDRPLIAIAIASISFVSFVTTVIPSVISIIIIRRHLGLFGGILQSWGVKVLDVCVLRIESRLVRPVARTLLGTGEMCEGQVKILMRCERLMRLWEEVSVIKEEVVVVWTLQMQRGLSSESIE